MIRAIVLTLCAYALAMVGCVDVKNKKTSIEVVDNGRHYYPILAGQELDVVYKIRNTGENPLLITDIITSCGCLVLSKSVIKNIPPNEEGILRLTYNSTKNIGFVKHYITLYGNFATSEMQELTFDINVVPNALYTKDYEELFLEEKEKYGNVKDLLDGNESNKGYYMDLN